MLAEELDRDGGDRAAQGGIDELGLGDGDERGIGALAAGVVLLEMVVELFVDHVRQQHFQRVAVSFAEGLDHHFIGVAGAGQKIVRRELAVDGAHGDEAFGEAAVFFGDVVFLFREQWQAGGRELDDALKLRFHGRLGGGGAGVAVLAFAEHRAVAQQNKYGDCGDDDDIAVGKSLVHR